MADTEDLRSLLGQLEAAPSEALTERLLELVYSELRAMAGGFLRRERPDHTLQPTALVHEAYLRLIEQKDVEWKGRAHFLAISARAMRRVLVDHARRHGAEKRGGARQRVTLSEVAGTAGREVDVLDLEEAIESLSREDARAAKVVEYKFYAGMTGEDIAQVLSVSSRTVKSDWAAAKLWLSRALKREGGSTDVA